MPPKQKFVQVAEEPVVQRPISPEPPLRPQLYLNLRSRSLITPGVQDTFAEAKCKVRIGSKTQWFTICQCEPPQQLINEPCWSNSWWFLGPPQTSERTYSLYWSDVRYYANELPYGTKTKKVDIIYEPTGRPDPYYHIFVIHLCEWELCTSYPIPTDLRHNWATDRYRYPEPQWPPAPKRAASPQHYSQNQPFAWQQAQAQAPQAKSMLKTAKVYEKAKTRTKSKKPATESKTPAATMLQEVFRQLRPHSCRDANERRQARDRDATPPSRRHARPSRRHRHGYHQRSRGHHYRHRSSSSDYLRGYGNVAIGREYKPHITRQPFARAADAGRYARGRPHHTSGRHSGHRRPRDYNYYRR